MDDLRMEGLYLDGDGYNNGSQIQPVDGEPKPECCEKGNCGTGSCNCSGKPNSTQEKTARLIRLTIL